MNESDKATIEVEICTVI